MRLAAGLGAGDGDRGRVEDRRGWVPVGCKAHCWGLHPARGTSSRQGYPRVCVAGGGIAKEMNVPAHGYWSTGKIHSLMRGKRSALADGPAARGK